jgi:hypothetical protein
MHALSRPGFSVCTERSEHTRTNRGDASKVRHPVDAPKERMNAISGEGWTLCRMRTRFLDGSTFCEEVT